MKSKNRALLLVFLVAVLLILSALGVLWYYTAHMDRSGWVQQNGYYYYLNEKGEPISGWMAEDGNRYYFGTNNAMVSGWQDIGGIHYYFSESGVLQTGWQEPDGLPRYFHEDGTPAQGWEYVDGERRYFLTDGLLATGWQVIDGMRCYLNQGGTAQTGWQTIGTDTFYFEESGVMHTGWFQEDEYTYYFNEDGTMAVSPTEIDGETCFFTPTGIYILLVNYRYGMPQNRQPELVRYGEWARVAKVAEQNLRRMILDCRATGIECWLNCGYRTQEQQQTILDERIEEYQGDGMSYEQARAKALETVALPGFSEHETGLAMDIVCSVAPDWLHEHCWEYGFILRYPENKSDITGISYEHWHYRYVGTKVSMAMKDSGLCLEEYVGAA